YAPLTPEHAQMYRDAQKSIVDTFKKSGVHFVVIGSPGCVDTRTFHKDKPGDAAMYNTTLGQLRDIDRDIAKEMNAAGGPGGAAFADVFAVMTDVMTKAKAKYGQDYDI